MRAGMLGGGEPREGAHSESSPGEGHQVAGQALPASSRRGAGALLARAAASARALSSVRARSQQQHAHAPGRYQGGGALGLVWAAAFAEQMPGGRRATAGAAARLNFYVSARLAIGQREAPRRRARCCEPARLAFVRQVLPLAGVVQNRQKLQVMLRAHCVRRRDAGGGVVEGVHSIPRPWGRRRAPERGKQSRGGGAEERRGEVYCVVGMVCGGGVRMWVRIVRVCTKRCAPMDVGGKALGRCAGEA